MMDSMKSHTQFEPQTNPGYGNWIHPLQFQKSNPSFWGDMKRLQAGFKKSLPPRVVIWESKRYNGKRRMQVHKSMNGKMNDYNAMLVNGLQHRGVLKPKNFAFKLDKHPRKTMTDFGNNIMVAPCAPRNTTSFLIRSKGRRCGIGPLGTPSPQTPAVYSTPTFSPSPDALMKKAEEEWGVNGYGSMNGLIRLKAQGHEPAIEMQVDKEDVIEIESSESDVEEHFEMEKRIDQDLSRFEMLVNPLSMMKKMDNQATHVAKLQEENSILKRRVLMMEREMEELSAKMHLFATRKW